jgi:transglutaminase-like putative cysteine protease
MWLGSLQRTATPTRVSLRGIPEGVPGAIQTLRVMRDLVRASIREPAQQVRETALGIIGGESGWIGQIRLIQQWVQDHIRYVLDPIDSEGGVELVQTPQKTLEYRAGDCDDQSVLIAALLSAIGHPARFIAVGFRGEGLSHVLVQTKVRNTGEDRRDWASVETIEPQALGWFPSGVTSHYILKV